MIIDIQISLSSARPLWLARRFGRTRDTSGRRDQFCRYRENFSFAIVRFSARRRVAAFVPGARGAPGKARFHFDGRFAVNFDARRTTSDPILETACGAKARLWRRCWRPFFRAVAGVLGHAGRNERGVDRDMPNAAALAPRQECARRLGASHSKRMAASWSRPQGPTGYKVAARSLAPDGAFPSDQGRTTAKPLEPRRTNAEVAASAWCQVINERDDVAPVGLFLLAPGELRCALLYEMRDALLEVFRLEGGEHLLVCKSPGLGK